MRSTGSAVAFRNGAEKNVHKQAHDDRGEAAEQVERDEGARTSEAEQSYLDADLELG